MPISSEKRETIKRYVLEHIDSKDKDFVSKTADTFSISRTTIYNYVSKMEKEGIITKSSDGNGKYQLVKNRFVFSYPHSLRLEEDKIYSRDIRPLLCELPKNVQDIWYYVFTEMMNNAIEHSEGTTIQCMVVKNHLYSEIAILDDGIGIFRKIQAFYKNEHGEEISLDEAVDALFPGKLTTSRENHSGEGIFFSSRAVDWFVIQSDNKFFSHNSLKDFRMDNRSPQKRGTFVLMRLSNSSGKQVKDVFDMFTDPNRGFFKTHIPISHIYANGYPVSRSEARRLGSFVQDFEEVTLDFSGVEQLGQAFTHELFVVFQRAHPEIKLSIENANSAVDAMIRRVINT